MRDACFSRRHFVHNFYRTELLSCPYLLIFNSSPYVLFPTFGPVFPSPKSRKWLRRAENEPFFSQSGSFVRKYYFPLLFRRLSPLCKPTTPFFSLLREKTETKGAFFHEPCSRRTSVARLPEFCCTANDSLPAALFRFPLRFLPFKSNKPPAFSHLFRF